MRRLAGFSAREGAQRLLESVPLASRGGKVRLENHYSTLLHAMLYHLAQMNIARMRGSPDEPVMAGMFARMEKMNQLAEQSAGFVWRWRGSDETPEALRIFEDYFVPFEPQHLFYNMSVWESVERLRHYVFRSEHAEMLRDKPSWIEDLDRAHLALWWIPAGHRPTVKESAERLRAVQEKGSTAYAFTFKECFPAPVV